MFRLVAAVIAAMVVGVPRPTAAQSGWPAAPDQLTIGAGVAVNSRVDQVVSPLQFGGRGAGVLVGYAGAGSHYALVASLAASAPELAPISGAPSDSRETLSNADLQLTMLRAWAGQSAFTRGLSIGASFGASVAMTSHRYDDPLASSATFLTALGTLGPAISWSQPLAAGLASIDLSVPVLALVTHSYSDIKVQHAGPEFRVATPSTFRGAWGSIAYSPAIQRRIGVTYRYAFGVMRYDDTQPLRSVSQSFTISLVTRFRRSAP